MPENTPIRNPGSARPGSSASRRTLFLSHFGNHRRRKAGHSALQRRHTMRHQIIATYSSSVSAGRVNVMPNAFVILNFEDVRGHVITVNWR